MFVTWFRSVYIFEESYGRDFKSSLLLFTGFRWVYIFINSCGRDVRRIFVTWFWSLCIFEESYGRGLKRSRFRRRCDACEFMIIFKYPTQTIVFIQSRFKVFVYFTRRETSDVLGITGYILKWTLCSLSVYFFNINFRSSL